LGGFTGLDLDGDGKFDIIFIPEGSFLDFFDVDDDGDDELYLDAEKGGQTGVKNLDGDTDTDVYWVSNTVSHFDFDGDGMSNSFEISIGNDIYTMEVDMDGDDEMETISHDPTLGPNIAHAEDTDGDGDKDKIKTGGNPIDFVTWDDAVVIVIESGDETSGGCTPVDLDSDGKSDVVFVAEGDLLDVGDNDGDGKSDIIFLKSNDTSLYWKDFDGDGTVDVFFVPDNYTYITSEDLDGDGEPETIFSDSGLKELEVIYIDLDGDGDIDVVKIPEGDLLGTKDADGDGDTELILKGGNPWLAKDDDGDGDYDTIWLDDDGSPDDADDDGWSNGKEQEMGTDPLDPTNFPSGETPDRNDEDGDKIIDSEDQCPSEDISYGLDSNQDGCLDQRPVTISVVDSSNNEALTDAEITIEIRDSSGRLMWKDGDGPIYDFNPGDYTVDVSVNILNNQLGMATQAFSVKEGEDTELTIIVSTMLPVKHIPNAVNGIASFIFGSLAYTMVRNVTASRGPTRSFTMGAVAGAATFGGSYWGLAMGLG
jgi:hypothetical protein